jgi:hypothetical protein
MSCAVPCRAVPSRRTSKHATRMFLPHDKLRCREVEAYVSSTSKHLSAKSDVNSTSKHLSQLSQVCGLQTARTSIQINRRPGYCTLGQHKNYWRQRSRPLSRITGCNGAGHCPALLDATEQATGQNYWMHRSRQIVIVIKHEMDGWMDGWVCEWTDGRTDGQPDR